MCDGAERSFYKQKIIPDSLTEISLFGEMLTSVRDFADFVKTDSEPFGPLTSATHSAGPEVVLWVRLSLSCPCSHSEPGREIRSPAGRFRTHCDVRCELTGLKLSAGDRISTDTC